MLKRPSLRRRGSVDEVGINLVPMLDTLVTLIAFLLYSMAFLSIVSIDTPVPVASASRLNESIKERPLQLTLTLQEKESLLWSPFDRITQKTIPHTEEGRPDVLALHDALVSIKQKFPKEQQLVLVPSVSTSYDDLVAVMDHARDLQDGDPPFYQENPKTGVSEAVRKLFPNVVFGNLLGDD